MLNKQSAESILKNILRNRYQNGGVDKTPPPQLPNV